MLKLHDLYKVYRTDEVETVALNGVNLEIEQGDFVAIMGPSGCGKSTLLNIVGMLDNPSEGDYWFFDENVVLYHNMPSAERKRRVLDVMDRMGIGHRASHMPGQLSGGQQQRVAVARAVVGDQPLILADEPTGNLDSVHGQEVMELLQSLNKEGTTIVMVTHSPSHADYAHRTVNLFDGHIVTENTRAA